MPAPSVLSAEVVATIQRRLKALGSNLGTSGPNRDGVDGEWGPVTQGELFKRLGLPPDIIIPTTTIQPPPSASVGKLPTTYAWLNEIEGIPRTVLEGVKLLGTKEIVGAGNSPIIMGWAAEVGESAIGYKYTGDAVPWCGLFMAVVAKRAGKTLPFGPLYALNWGAFGVSAGQPGLGDVITFLRDGGGHVGIYIAEDRGTAAKNHEDACYHILGGNQSDSVSITRILKKRAQKMRRPSYNVTPLGVRPFIVNAQGSISTNEA